jgi:hypothetical protein
LQSSFLVKRESGRIQFSAEKYNLMAKNSFKFQGIANGKAVDIQQYYDNKKPKGIVLSTKSSKGINKPVCLFLARAKNTHPHLFTQTLNILGSTRTHVDIAGHMV